MSEELPELSSEEDSPNNLALLMGIEWFKDSSLEKWFPISAEQIAKLTTENADLRAKLDEVIPRALKFESECVALTAKLERAEACVAEMRQHLFKVHNCCCDDDEWDSIDSDLIARSLSAQCGVGLLEKVKRLREALKDVTECSEVVLANAHWEVSYGSGDLRNALKRAKQAIAPEAAP